MCWSRKREYLLGLFEIKLTVLQFISNGINMCYVNHSVEQSSYLKTDSHSTTHQITLFTTAHY
jgi:hypothetical protein